MSGSLRIDRWLYFCRVFKTRSPASAAVTGGHVKLNGERPGAGARVKAGDHIELVRDRVPYAFEVTAIPARRGPATEAKSCYAEVEKVVADRELKVATLKQDRMLMPKTPGRPDKHSRRKLRERGRGNG